MSQHRPTVLLVEDDANDVLLLRRALAKAQLGSVDLKTVSDGDAAIAYLSQQAPYNDQDKHPLPTLLLLDIKLPCRSGLEVLEWIRQQPQLKRLLVIILTGSKEQPDLEKAYDLGVNSYLVKPGIFADLVDLMKTLHNYWLSLNEHPQLSLT
ncbi:Response regulator rcp1 [Acaryochloris thomasi RCC1774]|uniref:Response regulator rcp1 n=1 Tax=Acaryochloris thomasi RCC1774 TaxID=1764569 RepID=A0A2W1JYV9_9CYAN|nr:response regulator [Acaryochloris thomasi]PZD75395.1 Response regulator rcp1 [Acaryochloris thomasi RCC1774]